MAQAQWLSRRPGAGVPAVADGHRDRDVSQRQESAASASRATASRWPFPRVCACGGCTRRSCAITIPTTGRCCARRCGAWAARPDRQRASAAACPPINPPAPASGGERGRRTCRFARSTRACRACPPRAARKALARSALTDAARRGASASVCSQRCCWHWRRSWGPWVRMRFRARLSPERYEVLQTAVHYQFFHALGLMGLGILSGSRAARGCCGWAGGCCSSAYWCFRGSLYLLLAGAPQSWWASLTPIGGLALIAGWCASALALRHGAQSAIGRRTGQDLRELWRRWLLPAVTLMIFVLVGFGLHRQLAEFRFSNVLARLTCDPAMALLGAVLCTAVSYLLLGFYDVLALRYLGKPCRTRARLFTSFIAYAFGHNFGIAAFTGGAVRYRLYSSAGPERRRRRHRGRFLRGDHRHRSGCAGGGVIHRRAAPGRARAAHESRTSSRRWAWCCWRLVGLYALWSLVGPRRIEISGWALRAPRAIGRLAADRAGGGGPGDLGAGAVAAAAGRQRGESADFRRRLCDRDHRRRHQPRSRRPRRI